MRFLLKALLSCLVVGVSACASSGGSEPAATPNPGGAAEATPPVASATQFPGFTSAQANRGRDTFRATCTECHYSSEFSDSQFKFKWSRRSAGDLFQLIQTEMPESDPGSLSPEQVVEIVSYMLRMNGFEASENELSSERAVLDGISLASIRDE